MQELQDIVVQQTENVEENPNIKEVAMNLFDHRGLSMCLKPWKFASVPLVTEANTLLGERINIHGPRGDLYEEIAMIGKGASCYNCRGHAHFAKDCSTPEGKDEGTASKGKGRGGGNG